MIAPADFPPHPTKGKILVDFARNVLIWEKSYDDVTPEERTEAEYRKSIASYSAPWNPKVGQKWLDLKTNLVMRHLGGQLWYFDSDSTVSTIAVSRYDGVLPSYPPQSFEDPPKCEPKNTPAKPIPEEPEPPKKSRVFTFE